MTSKGATRNVKEDEEVEETREEMDIVDTCSCTRVSKDPEEEVKLFMEFGLGRGVDVTDSNPFVNKKFFQVRLIKSDETIICTDEGGALHSIFQSLETSDTHAINLSGSVTLQETPIHIGTALDYLRSTMQRGYVAGRKVMTRSVAFRMDHEEKVKGLEGNEGKGVEDDKMKGVEGDEEYFENWLSSKLEKTASERVNELLKLITKLGITHYVSKICLGAAEYCMMSEVYYSSFVKSKKVIGVDKIAELALSASKKSTSSSHISETKRIGLMWGKKSIVRRGTYDEAVVDVQLESITKLIKNDSLKKDLTIALRLYVATRRFSCIGYNKKETEFLRNFLKKSTEGVKDVAKEGEVASKNNDIEKILQLNVPPNEHEETHRYAICCKNGEDFLFLDVNGEKHKLVARALDENAPNACFFNLRLTDTPGEFVIMDYENFDVKTKKLKSSPKLNYDFWPTPRYLKVNTHLGCKDVPLCMENSVDERDCRLTIRPRLFHKKCHVSMSDFTNGKDMFYICTSRRHGRKRYLYVKATPTVTAPPTVAASPTAPAPSTVSSPPPITAPPTAPAPSTVSSPPTVAASPTALAPSTVPVPLTVAASPTALAPSTVPVPLTVAAPPTALAPSTVPVPLTVAAPPTALAPSTVPVPLTVAASPTALAPSTVPALPTPPAASTLPSPPSYILASTTSIKRGNSAELMLFRLVRFENMYVPDDDVAAYN